MNNKAKRALWFCNHETLREFEVPKKFPTLRFALHF